MIYRLRFDRFNYFVFNISAHEIEFKIGDFFLLQQPIWRDFWKPVCAHFSDFSDKGRVTKLPEITLWFTDRLAMNQAAYDLLSNDLEPYGELLPVTCEGIPYWILHVTKKTNIECVDMENSEREIIEECEYIDVKSLVFKEEKLQDLLIFQTEYNDYTNIYCTEKFKSLIESTGLKGLLFSTDLAGIHEP